MTSELSYADRLVNQLKASNCPTVYVEVVQKFVETERKKKAEYAAANQGVLTFGKYKDKDVREVYKLDPSYCKWLHEKSSKFLRSDVKDILSELLK